MRDFIVKYSTSSDDTFIVSNLSRSKLTLLQLALIMCWLFYICLSCVLCFGFFLINLLPCILFYICHIWVPGQQHPDVNFFDPTHKPKPKHKLRPWLNQVNNIIINLIPSFCLADLNQKIPKPEQNT